MALDVPTISARTLAWFRIALGACLLAVFLLTELRPVPLDAQGHYGTPDIGFVHRLASDPAVCAAMPIAAAAAAGLFMIGVWPRATYAVAVVGFALITWITLERRSAHDLGLPLITLLGWMAVPWEDTGRRGPAAAVRDVRYGFALWWPGLTLGLAFFSAACSKLLRSGVEWVSTGAIRYHFVTDGMNAPFAWGLWIASQPELAVVLSFAAISLEALFVTVVLAPPRYRPMYGLAAAGLLFGFYAFQGVRWWGWWLPLVAFLPWHWADRAAPVAAAGWLRSQQVAVAVMIGVQLVALSASLDAEPLVSRFPMYGKTYASPDAFDREMQWRYTEIDQADADGVDARPLLHALGDDDRTTIVGLAENHAPDSARAVARACAAYQQRAPWPRALSVRLRRGGFDWSAGRYREPAAVVTRPVPVAAVCAAATSQARQ